MTFATSPKVSKMKFVARLAFLDGDYITQIEPMICKNQTFIW